MASVAPHNTPQAPAKRTLKVLNLLPKTQAEPAQGVQVSQRSESSRGSASVFSKAARRGLVALAEAMFDGAPGLSEPRFALQVDAIERVVGASSVRGQWGVRLAVWALRYGPFLFLGTARPIEKLKLSERIEYIERLEQSRISAVVLVFFAIRTLLIATFYEDAAAYEDPVFVAIERSRTPIPPEAASGVRMRGLDTKASQDQADDSVMATSRAQPMRST